MPADDGEYVKLLSCNNVPPEGALYQSIVSPAETVAFITGTDPPEQYDLSPPLTGG